MQYRLKPLVLAVAAAMPLFVQAADQENDVIVVTAERESWGAVVERSSLPSRRALTSDTANLLRDIPGISLYGAGGVSSLPAIHGLADDRIRTQVDGMDLIASCPNHMNSPLSYIDPTNVESVKVYAGITPVSVGGDSIGGTIQINSAKPEFAQAGEGILTKGQVGTSYRSNGNATASNLSATVAGENLSFYYRGSQAESQNYKAAETFKNAATLTSQVQGKTSFVSGDTVASTRYKTENQEVGFAIKNANHVVDFKVGIQRTPYQAYPNQRMDMLDNQSTQFNLRYLGAFDWGKLEASLYRQLVKHFMNFGDEKTSMSMPMNTESQLQGATLKATINYSEAKTIRTGTEIIKYALDDWWPASPTHTMIRMMGPNTQWNIQNGTRDRFALFGELETKHTPEWLSLFGLRHEVVNTNAGNAAGYNNCDRAYASNTAPGASATVCPGGGVGMATSYLTDSSGFNAQERAKTDRNWDFTALARYIPSETQSYEGGYARKTRSPNLYERYTWATDGMSAIMNNYVGDGNGYRGDPGLKPEIAHTLSVTGNWHDAAKEQWGVKATPYYTYVENYIGAKRCTTGDCATDATSATTQLASNKFIVLDYVNQNAELYGINLSGFTTLGKTSSYGSFTLTGLVNYAKGRNRDTGDYLYNIMPLNTKLALHQKLGQWTNTIENVLVAGKNQVSATRNEIATDAYSLFNLRTSYETKQARIDFGIENLFDRFYQLPLGGAYTGQGGSMSQNGIAWGVPVPGMGRTFYAGLNIKF